MGYEIEFIVRTGDHINRYPIATKPVYVGREPDAAERVPDSEVIVIRDAAISRWQFTLHPQGDHIEVEMNPRSPNQLLRDGRVSLRERFYPGEFFTIGPHRFEIDAKAELPLPAPNALPADPAGDPDISLAAEYERIVPSWRSQLEGKEAQVATQLPAIPAVPAWRRLLLPAAAFVVLGGAAYSWLVPRGGEDARSERPNLPDVFVEIRPIECSGEAACTKVAQEQYQSALALLEHEPEDILSKYKIARSLHRARLARPKGSSAVPELDSRYEQARQSFETSFADLRFRYHRAKERDDPNEQLSTIENIRSICKEEPLSFCTAIELTYQKLREQQ